MATKTDIAWAAGLFEGEGCFTWHGNVRTTDPKHPRYPTAHLTMTDEDVVRRFAMIVGIGKVTMPTLRSNRKQQWRWRAFGAEAMLTLDATIGPYLGERRRGKLDEMLTYKRQREAGTHKWIGGRPYLRKS